MRQGYREEQIRETISTGMAADFRDTNVEAFMMDRSMLSGAPVYGHGKKMSHSVGSRKTLSDW